MTKTEELYDVINQALTFALANLHTIVVCKVTSVGEKTISCRPVINRVMNGESKPFESDFVEVPPIFLNGGSSHESWPISVDDYCLLFISERCFDAWYYGDDFVDPIEMRMHDYSDGFALVGIQNNAGAITIPDLITRIGDMYAQGDWGHDGNLTRTGDETVVGNLIRNGDEDVTGSRNQTGTISATQDISSDTKVSAPILSGVLTGVGGTPPNIPQPVTATELHAGDGYTGTVTYLKDLGGGTGTITFVDGICTGTT